MEEDMTDGVVDPQGVVDEALKVPEPVVPAPPIPPVPPVPPVAPTIPPITPVAPVVETPVSPPMNPDMPLAFVPPAPGFTPVAPAPAPTIPVEPPKKKSKLGVVLAGIVGLFVVLGGSVAGYLYYTENLPPSKSTIASIQEQFTSPKDCNGACYNGRLLRWNYAQDKCVDSGKACEGGGAAHSVVVDLTEAQCRLGDNPGGADDATVWCDGCGGFCIKPVDKTCNQMQVEKCGESPVFGASCSTTPKTGYTKSCSCSDGNTYYFDSEGICNQAEANKLGLKDQNYDEVGLCALGMSGCDNSGTGTGPGGQPMSCDFTCSSSGCKCNKPDNECLVNHWKCNRIDNLTGGCQDGTPKTGQSASFSESCGSEQIDVWCHGDSVAFRSRVNSVACGATPSRPPRSPLPSASVGYSMSCTGLTKNVAAPAIGNKVTFTCAGATVPAAGASLLRYDFRYKIDSGNWQVLANKTAATAELTVDACGTYGVQCRACVTYGGATTCDPIWQGASQ